MTHHHFFYLELSEKHGWHCLNYAQTFDLAHSTVKDDVQRIDVTKLSKEEFVKQYEQTYTPVVLTNAQTDWPAKYKWTLDVCINSLKYINVVFSDYHSHFLKVILKKFYIIYRN